MQMRWNPHEPSVQAHPRGLLLPKCLSLFFYFCCAIAPYLTGFSSMMLI